MNMKSKWN